VPHLKLTLAYDGTGLVGWQRQASGTSVQGLLEEALAHLEGGPVVVSGAGRTDAGVHALGQVASVSLSRPIAPLAVLRAVNVRLPPAVRVVDVQEVGPDFHARFRATAKRYRYRIWNGPVVSPFERAYVWHVPWPVLDVEAMRAGAARLVGTHDFAAFQGAGGDVETSVRTLWSSAVEVRELMNQWHREHAAAGKQPWSLRIGLHSGAVVAGVVGKRKFAYDIWGDAVNTASRMESSGEPGEVNISGATYELVKDYFECEHRGQIEAKNKGRIDMYFVRRLKPAYSGDKQGTTPNEALSAKLGIAQEQFA